MKKIFYVATMAAALFTACEKNSDPTNSDNREVSFAIDEVVTRVTTTGSASAFDSGDVVKIASDGLEQDHSNIQYKVDNGSLVYGGENAAPKWVYARGDDGNDSPASFVAHYPSTLNLTDNKITMDVAPNQSDKNLFHNQMLMIATSTGNPNNNNGVVKFKFEHQMAMVKINVTVPDGVDVSSVTLDNVKPTVTWTNGETPSLVAAGDVISVLPWRQQTVENEPSEWWALIPAQTINRGTALITIATNKGTYGYTLPADMDVVFDNAKTQKIKLILEEDKVNADFSLEDGINPDNWGSNGADISGDLTYQPLVLISDEQGNFENVSLNATVSGYASVSDFGWTPVVATNKGTVLKDSESNSIAITASSAESAQWHNLALLYKTANKVTPGTYILTCELKVTALNYTLNDETKRSQLEVKIMQPNVQPNSANITWSGKVYIQPTGTESFTSFSKEITINANATGSNSPTTEATLANGVLVAFYPSVADDITYYIKNVTLKEKVETPVQ